MKGSNIFERNADACETARNPKCVCACGGSMHGLRHSPLWRRKTQVLLSGELFMICPFCNDVHPMGESCADLCPICGEYKNPRCKCA